MQISRGSSVITGRGFVVFQWLAVLKEINPLYNDIKVPEFRDICKIVKDLNYELFQDSITTTHAADIMNDNALGDDVAEVRNNNVDSSDNEVNLSSSLVSKPNYNINCEEAILTSASYAFGDEEKASRGEKLNEFQNNDFAISGTFPHIFLYGTAYGNKGGLNDQHRRHLLFQYSNIPSQTTEMIYFLYDQQVRHNNMIHMSKKIKSAPEEFLKFSAELESEEFQLKLDKSLKNPKSKEAKEVINRLMPILLSSSKESRFASFDSEKVKYMISSLVQFRGPCSAFFTIAPDDVNNPRVFQLSMRSNNNEDFPCKEEGLIEEMIKSDGAILGSGNVRIPVHYKYRLEAANLNPVATSIEYIRLLQLVFEEIIGVNCNIANENAKFKNTRFFMEHKKGIFGHAISAIGVNEDQNRGALHAHIAIWGGISPRLLEFASSLPHICNEISDVLDSIYKAEIPLKNHVSDLIRKNLPSGKKIPYDPPALTAELCLKNQLPLHDAAKFITYNNGIHEHKMTCHKLPNGRHGCRLCRPFGYCNKTGPVQIDRDETETNGTLTLFESVQSYLIDENVKYFNKPDTRLICWELKRRQLNELEISGDKKRMLQKLKQKCDKDEWKNLRPILNDLSELSLQSICSELKAELPNRNGYVVEFNPIFTSLTGAHSNLQFLGNEIQAKAALFYLAKYFAKNKIEISSFLTIVVRARKYIEQKQSEADDNGTIKRKTQFWLQRILHSLDGMSEIADTQAAAALLGLEAVTCSEILTLIPIKESINYVHQRREGGKYDGLPDKEDDRSENSSISSFESDSFIEKDDQSDTDSSESEENNLNKNDSDSEVLSESEFQSFFDLNLIKKNTTKKSSSKNLLGPATIYKLEEGEKKIMVPVLFPENYEYRGIDLRYLSRTEYYCIIQPPTKKQPEVERINSLGRNRLKQIHFGMGHPLFATHDQKVRSTLCVPRYTLKIPIWPGEPPEENIDQSRYNEWKTKADSFSKYVLTAFRPEINNFDQYNRDYNLKYDVYALGEYLEQLKSCNSVISKSRYHLILTTMKGLKTEHAAKVLLSRYRKRNRDMWDTNFNYDTKESGVVKADDIDLFYGIEEDFNLTTQEMCNALKSITYSHNMIESLKSSLPKLNNHNNNNLPKVDTVIHNERSKDVYNYYNKLKEKEIEEEIELDEEDNNNYNYNPVSNDNLEEKLKDFYEINKFTESQKQVIDLVVNEYKEIDEIGHSINPDIYFIRGEPGTGKSYCIKSINDLTKYFPKIKCIKTAFMGIAAVNISGNTIQDLFHISGSNFSASGTHLKRKLSEKQLIKLRNIFNIDISKDIRRCILIIDEIGMVNSALLAAINSRMQEITGLDLPFGGITTFFFGDFNQLDPVKSKSLISCTIQKYFRDITKDRLEYNNKNKSKKYIRKKRKQQVKNKNQQAVNISSIKSHSFHIIGIDLFQNAKVYQLKEQVRSEDYEHSKFLSDLSSCIKFPYKELKKFKILDENDLEFQFAPLLVSTNRERFDMSEIQAIRFAKFNNTIVIRWPLTILEWKGRPYNYSLAKENDPAFWQYFVVGAPAFCTKNINTKKGLANGTSMICDSITPLDRHQEETIRNFIKYNGPGSILTLDRPPKSVNFEVPSLNNENCINGATIKKGKRNNCPVIPLIKEGEYVTSEWYTIRGGVKYGFKPSKAKISSSFPFDLGFAMTIHKSQGRTLPNLTLVISERSIPISQFNWSAIYVALSRVKRRNDIRFLIAKSDEDDKYNAIKYVTSLEPKIEVKLYFSGFDHKQGCKWDPEKSYDSKIHY